MTRKGEMWDILRTNDLTSQVASQSGIFWSRWIYDAPDTSPCRNILKKHFALTSTLHRKKQNFAEVAQQKSRQMELSWKKSLKTHHSTPFELWNSQCPRQDTSWKLSSPANPDAVSSIPRPNGRSEPSFHSPAEVGQKNPVFIRLSGTTPNTHSPWRTLPRKTSSTDLDTKCCCCLLDMSKFWVLGTRPNVSIFKLWTDTFTLQISLH